MFTLEDAPGAKIAEVNTAVFHFERQYLMGDLERGGNMLQIFSLTLLVNNTEEGRRDGWLYIYKKDSMLQVSVIAPCDEQDRGDRSGDMQGYAQQGRVKAGERGRWGLK